MHYGRQPSVADLGMGVKVLEVIPRHDGDTYRAVYTVQFKFAVYVLTCLPEEGLTGHRAARPLPTGYMHLADDQLAGAEGAGNFIAVPVKNDDRSPIRPAWGRRHA